MLYADTRQQSGKHVHVDRWFEEHGVEFEYKKLDFGDYMVDGLKSNYSVDTKQDMQELAGNLGRAHDRFARECERAAAAGCRLVILVEQHPEYNERALVDSWTSGVCLRCRRCNPREKGSRCVKYRCKPMQGPQLARIMATMERKYGVRFEFCSRKDTAKRICELLGIEVGDV